MSGVRSEAAPSAGVEAIVRLERDGEVAHLHFNYAERANGLDDLSIPQLRETLQAADADESLKFLVLHGYVGRFCIGGSGEFIGSLLSDPLPRRVERIRAVQSVVRACAECRLLTVAHLDGLAAGAGVDLALATDLILASPNARLSLLYAKLGLVPDTGLGLLARRRPRVSPLILYAQSDVLRAPDIVDLGLGEALQPECGSPSAIAAILRRRFRHDPIALRASKALESEAFFRANSEIWEDAAKMQAKMLDRPEVRNRIERSAAMQAGGS